MKKTLSAVALCISLTVISCLVFNFEYVSAQQDVITSLLDMPAPPPISADGIKTKRKYDKKFFSKSNPPADGAPIDDLVAYWKFQNDNFSPTSYRVKPTASVKARLFDYLLNDPGEMLELINIFVDDQIMIGQISNLAASHFPPDSYQIERINEWLKFNSDAFSQELADEAAEMKDTNGYIENDDEFRALAKHNWERARPMVDQFYSQKESSVSRTTAIWALYRRALDTGSMDAERYRTELMNIVTDRSLTDSVRDMALDALSLEKEWPGRDDWYFGLLEDETLLDLKYGVGSTLTGLTTMITHSPNEKYRDKMIELAGSSNQTVKRAAIKNLIVMLREPDEIVIRALLPALEDEKWNGLDKGDLNSIRMTITRHLAEIKMPEAVPGLITLLETEAKEAEYEDEPDATDFADEANDAARVAADAARKAVNRSSVTANVGNSAANRAAEAASKAADEGLKEAIRKTLMAANAAKYAADYGYGGRYYMYLSGSASALAFQRDQRAVPALRRLMNSAKDRDERMQLAYALYRCGGYSQADIIKNIEWVAKERSSAENKRVEAANIYATNSYRLLDRFQEIYDDSLEAVVANAFFEDEDADDGVVSGLVYRIGFLEKSDPPTAKQIKNMLMTQNSSAAHIFALKEVRENKADKNTVVKLLAERKFIKEKLSTDLYSLATASEMGKGLLGCISEQAQDLKTSVITGSAETAAMALACARLIRFPLYINDVVPHLNSSDVRLALAAELYLVSDDSPAARLAILARNQNKALILGSTTGFFSKDTSGPDLRVSMPFKELLTITAPTKDLAESEELLRSEAMSDEKLLGIYGYGKDTVKIYQDGAVFNRFDDRSRYQERKLADHEYKDMLSLLQKVNIDEMQNHSVCDHNCDNIGQLTMVGRAGGRRVFWQGEKPAFFAQLEKILDHFADGKMTYKYLAAKELDGFEILFHDPNFRAHNVFKSKGDLYSMTLDSAEREKLRKGVIEAIRERFEFAEKAGMAENFDRALEVQKYYESGRDRYVSYTRLLDGKATRMTLTEFDAQNDGSVYAPEGKLEPMVSEDSRGLSVIIDGKKRFLLPGRYHSSAISSDGKLVIAMEFANYESVPVKVDVATGRKQALSLKTPKGIRSIQQLKFGGYLSGKKRFLVLAYELMDEYTVGNRSVGYLLNPDTGHLEPVNGETRPWAHRYLGSTQPTDKIDEIWAAIPDRSKNETRIGRYDLNQMKFTPVVRVPHLAFDSSKLWVDVDAKKVYVAYEGHVVSFTLNEGKL